MRTIDDDFRALVSRHAILDEAAADQLQHAARALAQMEPWMASSITCMRRVPADQAEAFADLARELANELGLAVRVDAGTPMSVRFSRRGDEQ